MDINIESRFTQKLGCLQGAHLCHLWELLCCCGGRIPPLLSSAPNESVLICAICGRLSSAAGSVDSVQSVGGLLLARLVHFLLWQAAKPSGDKCTPLKMHLCHLWEVLLSSRFCVNLCHLWENIRTLISVDSVDSVGGISRQRVVRSFLRSRGRRRRRIPARYTCVR